MAKGTLVVLTRPTSKDREAEFNEWYEKIHAPEVCAVAGVSGMTRYRFSPSQMPDTPTPRHEYLAIYHLDDVEKAVSGFLAVVPTFTMSDSVDTADAVIGMYETIFTYQK